MIAYGAFQVISKGGWNRGVPTGGFQSIAIGVLLILAGLAYLWSLYSFFRRVDNLQDE